MLWSDTVGSPMKLTKVYLGARKLLGPLAGAERQVSAHRLKKPPSESEAYMAGWPASLLQMRNDGAARRDSSTS